MAESIGDLCRCEAMPLPGEAEVEHVVLHRQHGAHAAQAACIALPGAGLPAWAARFRAGAWALVLPLSIAVVVGAIAVLPTTADVLTWTALLLVPAGAALALGWAARGARPWRAVLAAPLLALAWAVPHERAGQAATVILIAGSAITAGRLIAGVAPLALLKAGVLAMAVIDAILVFSNNLQGPNAVLIAATPGAGLPSSSPPISRAPGSATETSSPPRSWAPSWRSRAGPVSAGRPRCS